MKLPPEMEILTDSKTSNYKELQGMPLRFSAILTAYTENGFGAVTMHPLA